MFNKIYLQVKDYDGEENTEELITFAPVRINESDVEYTKTTHIMKFIEWKDKNVCSYNSKTKSYLYWEDHFKTIEEIYKYWLDNIIII